MRTQKQWLKHLDFIILDIIITALAFLCACALRPGPIGRLLNDPIYPRTLEILAGAAALTGFLLPLHRGILRRSWLDEARETAKLVLIQAAAVSFFNYAGMVSNNLSRLVFGMYLVLAFLMLLGARSLHKSLLNRRLTDEKKLHKLVLIANEKNLEHDTAWYRKNGEKRFQVVAVAVLNEEASVPEDAAGKDCPVLIGHEALYRFLQSEVIDEILISDIGSSRDEALLQKLMSMGATIFISLEEAYDILPNKHIDTIGDRMILTSTVQPFSPEQMAVKRAMDILMAIAGLVLTGIVCIIFGPIIMVQSPGPIFYSQIRVGLNGRQFRMYKFRSMIPDADKKKAGLMDQNKMNGLMFKVENDPRIIPIGRFMRKYSLDELPQFYNVLRGDMSTVGTRPPTIDEWEQYSLEHRARLSMKPGITGLWQVSGRNDIVDFDEVVSLDMKYIREWSLRQDLAIIARTIVVVIRGKGAS